MTCLITFTYPGRVIRKGSQPRRPVRWNAQAWFIQNGEKNTHSCITPPVDAVGLAPYMGALIDSLISDVGNQVTGAGWTAYTA